MKGGVEEGSIYEKKEKNVNIMWKKRWSDRRRNIKKRGRFKGYLKKIEKGKEKGR